MGINVGWPLRFSPGVQALLDFPTRESGTWNMVPHLCCVAWQRDFVDVVKTTSQLIESEDR